jgi:LytS/YehU family sensor histidine kinase
MAEYELQILKLQLHPHFLFNTLNGISALMMRDVKTAREMIVRLSDLLRIALSHNSRKQITLRQELEFIDAYLQIEQMRFGSRLWVNVAVDPATLDAAVPNMILQPLVENAIRHGIAPQRSGGGVEITTSRNNGDLRIVVANDGPEIRGPVVTDSGIGLGLGNTRARLWQLYGDAYNLQMEPRQQGGVEVRLEIPFLEMKENAQHA